MLCLRRADQKQGILADTTEAEGEERLRHDAMTPAPKGEKETKILAKLPSEASVFSRVRGVSQPHFFCNMWPLVWGSDHPLFPPVQPLLPPELGQDVIMEDDQCQDRSRT